MATPVRDDLLEPATVARLARARAGEDVARRLRLADLEPGDVGVLEVQVRAVAPPRTYGRKRGGQGMLQRIALADGSGEVDLVLWDDELRHAKGADAPFQHGAFLRLRGAAVKAGHRGGVELGLGSAVVEALPPPSAPERGLTGKLVGFGEVRPVGAPPALRFTMDVVVELAEREGGGRVQVAAWDATVKALRAAGLGATVRLPDAVPNPLLEGWWTATGAVERPGRS